MFRKDLFFIVITIFFGISKISGQNSRFSMGIAGGVGFSGLGGSDFARQFFSPKLGYTAGFTMEYKHDNKISLVSGLFYENKGAINNFAFVSPDPSTGDPNFAALVNNYNYLVLPVLFRITFNKRIPLFVNAGPYGAYMVEKKSVINNPGFTIAGSDPEARKWDMGITAGAGLKIPVNHRYYFSLETRFNFGTVNIKKNNTEIKNYTGNLILGFAYNFDARNQGK